VVNLNMVIISKNMGMAVRISWISGTKELNNQICMLVLYLVITHFISIDDS